MKKTMKIAGVLILMGCILSSTAFADPDHYHDRNFFNHFTDWFATMGKGPEEKQRVIDQRVETRAHWRQEHDHGRDRDRDQVQSHEHDRDHDHDHGNM